jgi:hypothetical protein
MPSLLLARHPFWLVFISSWCESISEAREPTCVSIISCMAFRSSVICTTFVVWCYNDRDPMQFPVQPLLRPVAHVSDYRWDLDWWMDLLTTYTHHSELQLITAVSLISTHYKSPQHPLSLFPGCCVFVSLPCRICQLTVNWIIEPSLLSHPCRTQLSIAKPQLTGLPQLSSL